MSYCFISIDTKNTVSYTHLDVYKRQGLNIVKVETTTTFNCYIDSGTYENVKLPLMINLGGTALPYEPYTGGVPAVVDTGINIDLSDGGTVTQSMPVMLPGGLPGIPVAAGGNYTCLLYTSRCV